MPTKITAEEDLSGDEAKYRPLIEDCRKELLVLQKEIVRQRAKTERQRKSSNRLLKDTWETLRRVEATL